MIYVYTLILFFISFFVPLECTAPKQINCQYIFKPQQKAVKIAAVGDIVLGLNYPDSLPRLTKSHPEELLKYHYNILHGADLTIGNLEGVLLNTGGTPKIINNDKVKYLFRMPEHYSEILRRAGFDFLSIANNHSRDFGMAGLNSTMNNLSNAGIHYAGIKNICEYSIIKKDSLRYGICAFAPNGATVSLLNYEYAAKIVRNLKKECDIVVVSMHVGAEGVAETHVPKEMEVFHGELRGDAHKFAHTMIDCGADLIIGHGPHVVRALELYKNRLIAYSLGNYCTPYGVSKAGKGGYAPLLEVKLKDTGEFINGKIHGAIQFGVSGPSHDAEKFVINEIRRLTKEDFPNSPLKIDTHGNIECTI